MSKWCKSGTTGNQNRLSGLAGSQLVFFILTDCKVIRLFLFQGFKHQIHRVLELLIIFPHLHCVQELNQGGEILFLNRSFIVDISDQGTVEQRFRLRPELITGFSITFVLAISVVTSFRMSFSEWI